MISRVIENRVGTLFCYGQFKLHSGGESNFKIDTDVLSDVDWDCLAQIIASKFKFGKVKGIPTGASKLEHQLKRYVSADSKVTLLVDDVLTTGKSMEVARTGIYGECIGVVVFARGKCPDWIYPIFQMWEQ